MFSSNVTQLSLCRPPSPVFQQRNAALPLVCTGLRLCGRNMRLASCSKHTSKGRISAGLNKFAEAAGLLSLSHSLPPVSYTSFIRSGKFPTFSPFEIMNLQNTAFILSQQTLFFSWWFSEQHFLDSGFPLHSSWQGADVFFFLVFFFLQTTLQGVLRAKFRQATIIIWIRCNQDLQQQCPALRRRC